MAKWPVGIKPHGAGLRISLYRKSKRVYSETLAGDPFSPTLLATAKKRYTWLKARHDLGLPLTQGEAQSPLFEDVAQGYLDTLDAKHSTHLSYENILNHYWMPVFCGRPVTEITAREIKELLASFSVSPKTRTNVLIPFRGVLDHGDVRPNPAAGITFKRRSKNAKNQAPESYTPAQRNTLIKKVAGVPVPEWLAGQPAAYFALLFGCGLRPCGEPLALLWTDYDGKHLSISKQITKRIAQPYTKTDMRRRVYVPSWVRPFLDALPSRFSGGHVFTNSLGGPHLDSDDFNAVWQRAHKLARIPYQVPYACRHTRASELLSIGINPADAARQLGHSVEMFLRTYAEWVEQFSMAGDESRFEGVAAPKVDSGRSVKNDSE
jgi:integrase